MAHGMHYVHESCDHDGSTSRKYFIFAHTTHVVRVHEDIFHSYGSSAHAAMLASLVRSSSSASRVRLVAPSRVWITYPRRTLSTSPALSRAVPESVEQRRNGDSLEDGRQSTHELLDKWNIDPQTGKRRVGSNWNYQSELSALAHRIGVESAHLPSLQVALRDRSAVGREIEEHGRLAVLGRSVLWHYVNEYLYFSYPKLEGSMLKDVGSFVMSDAALTELAGHLGVSQLIQTRKLLSEPSNSYVVTNAFYAVVGVLYEHQGGWSARSFVHDFVISQLATKDLSDIIKLQHPRFMLYAILKSKGQAKPVSRLIGESGRTTHFPSFVVGVYSGEKLLGEGCGTSIKRAEREAMMAALQTHFQTELSSCPLPSDHDDFIPEEKLQLLRTETEESEVLSNPTQQ